MLIEDRGCLQDANAGKTARPTSVRPVQYPDGTYTWRAHAPTMYVRYLTTYPDGAILVGGECPICGGLHRHSWGKSDRHRIGHCSSSFATKQQKATGYNLEFLDGEHPPHIAAAFAAALPLNNLAVAYDLISHGRDISHHRSRKGKIAWTPKRDDVRFALKVLEDCGAFDEARAIREIDRNLHSRQARRLAAASVWRQAGDRRKGLGKHREGQRMKTRLLEVIWRTWQQHGGPL